MSDLTRIKEILDGEIGKPLQNYIKNALEELKDIDNLQDYSTAQEIAIEVKAQKKAYVKLLDIFDKLMSIKSDKEEKSENEYAVM